MLVAKGRPAALTIEVRDYDGVLVAPTGNVAVVVKDVDETTVASGNASAGAETGVYTYALGTAVTGDVGVFEATATFTVAGSTVTRTYPIDVVGDYLFEIHELRAKDRMLENEEHYPAEALRAAREAATTELETAAQVAFATRAARATLTGDGTPELMLPHVRITTVHGVTLYDEDRGVDDDNVLAGTDLEDIEVRPDAGILVRTDGQVFPTGSNNVVVDYEHGYQTTPAPIRQAALTLAVEYLVPSSLPARATSVSSDLGDFRISVANEDLNRPTGIPTVDAAIQKYGYRRPSLGAGGR